MPRRKNVSVGALCLMSCQLPSTPRSITLSLSLSPSPSLSASVSLSLFSLSLFLSFFLLPALMRAPVPRVSLTLSLSLSSPLPAVLSPNRFPSCSRPSQGTSIAWGWVEVPEISNGLCGGKSVRRAMDCPNYDCCRSSNKMQTDPPIPPPPRQL